jgi:hypothetical protein
LPASHCGRDCSDEADALRGPGAPDGRLLCSVPLFLFRARESLPAAAPCSAARCALEARPGGCTPSLRGRQDDNDGTTKQHVTPCSPSSDPPTIADQMRARRAGRSHHSDGARATSSLLPFGVRGLCSLRVAAPARRSCRVGETDTMRTEKQRR